jgi:hypothetical protein
MKNESRTYHMTHCHLCFRNWPYFSLVFVFHKPKSNLSPISFFIFMHNFSGLLYSRNFVLFSFRFCTITSAKYVFFSLVLATEPKYSILLLKFRDFLPLELESEVWIEFYCAWKRWLSIKWFLQSIVFWVASKKKKVVLFFL